jgi:very-short-patch-repair endonuclease
MGHRLDPNSPTHPNTPKQADQADQSVRSTKGNRTNRSTRRRSSTLEIDVVLNRLAAGQLGIFTTSQAERSGVSKSCLHTRLASGFIVRSYRNVYRVSSVEETFGQRCLGACLSRERSVISRRSAAALHGMPIGSLPDLPELIIPHGSRQKVKGIQLHQVRTMFFDQRWHSGRILTPAATLVSIAPIVDPARLATCLDFAIANRLISVPRLFKSLSGTHTRGMTGMQTLRNELGQRIDGRVLRRSQLEQKAARWLKSFGVPPGKANMMIRTSSGNVEADFAWPEFKVILEISPFYTHGSKAAQLRDAQRRRALVAEGWKIIEATDEFLADATSFAPIAATIRSLLT